MHERGEQSVTTGEGVILAALNVQLAFPTNFTNREFDK